MKKLILTAGALLLASFVSAQPIPADTALRTGKLDNGMTYYVRSNAKPENQADFYIFHNVGAIQEEDSQQGLAHFLEHMAFNGTKNFPGKNLMNYLETIGVKFGANLNAYTSMEETCYNISSVPLLREGIIDSCLLILHDWSYYISLEDEEIDNERGVIIEELRTRNTAGWRLNEKVAPHDVQPLEICRPKHHRFDRGPQVVPLSGDQGLLSQMVPHRPAGYRRRG